MNEKDILARYLPDAAIDMVYAAITENKIHFKISRERKTKLGDYRPPVNHTNHRITINHNLNKYSFLITFIHELAHLKVYERYQAKVIPHGKEWKRIYRDLMLDLLKQDVFPDDISKVLKKSIQNSRASSTTDLKLSRILQRYDKLNGKHRLEDLPLEAIFKIQNGNQFVKGNRIRTRYKCLNLQNKKTYLFHPLTPVFFIG